MLGWQPWKPLAHMKRSGDVGVDVNGFRIVTCVHESTGVRKNKVMYTIPI